MWTVAFKALAVLKNPGADTLKSKITRLVIHVRLLLAKSSHCRTHFIMQNLINSEVWLLLAALNSAARWSQWHSLVLRITQQLKCFIKTVNLGIIGEGTSHSFSTCVYCDKLYLYSWREYPRVRTFLKHLNSFIPKSKIDKFSKITKCIKLKPKQHRSKLLPNAFLKTCQT